MNVYLAPYGLFLELVFTSCLLTFDEFCYVFLSGTNLSCHEISPKLHNNCRRYQINVFFLLRNVYVKAKSQIRVCWTMIMLSTETYNVWYYDHALYTLYSFQHG